MAVIHSIEGTTLWTISGNKIEKEYSFTRHVASSYSSSNSRPSSYYSLPSQIHNTSLNDKYHRTSKKKSGIKFKWKRLFSSSKTQKKNEVDLREIDTLAMKEVQSLQVPPINTSASTTPPSDDVDGKWGRQDSKKSSLKFNIAQPLPFKSHPIGGKLLQPLYKDKKTKKVPNFFLSIMTTDSFLQKGGKKGRGGNSKNSKKHTIGEEHGVDLSIFAVWSYLCVMTFSWKTIPRRSWLIFAGSALMRW